MRVPTYSYVCEACNDEFDVVQSFSDATLTEHDPGCGGHLRKRFNAVGVVFKGSGFYRNDSRGADTSSDGASSSSSSKPAESSTPAKTETASTPAAAPSSPAPSSPAPSTPAKTSAA